MTDSKTATERLREMLDARSVEYETYRIDFGEDRSNFHTEWGNDNDYLYVEYSDGPVLRMFGCTPEQAIAATLGSGECENVAKYWGEFECSECDTLADFGSDLHLVSYCPHCGKKVKR